MSKETSKQTHPALEMALETLRAAHKDPLLREAMRRAGELYWEEKRGRISSAHEAYVREWSGRVEPAMGLYTLAFGFWRLTKGAYLFDRDLFRELIETPLHRVPREALERLPEPAPLILFPEPLRVRDGKFQVHGAHVVFSKRPWEDKPPIFWGVTWFTVKEEGEGEKRKFVGWGVMLEEEDLEKAHAEGIRRANKAFGLPEPKEEELLYELSIVRPMVNLALYLCQEKPDYGGLTPRLPAEPRKTREGLRIFPPEEALVIPTGWRWGKALRLAREAEREARKGEGGSGRSPAPHIRRAHWHLYWTGEGSRKDPSRAVPQIRWVPATLVGRRILEALGLGLDDLPATVRPVEDQKGNGDEKDRASLRKTRGKGSP